jgi:hypothetical protein
MEVRPRRDTQAGPLCSMRERDVPQEPAVEGVRTPQGSLTPYRADLPTASRIARIDKNMGVGAGRASDRPSTAATATNPYFV